MTIPQKYGQEELTKTPGNNLKAGLSNVGSGTANKPVWKHRAGKFDVAVWSQPSPTGRGEMYSVTLRKSWTKDGTHFDEQKMSIFSRELPDAILLLQKTHETLRLKEQK